MANVEIMDLGNKADKLLQKMRTETLFKFLPGQFSKVISTLSPETTVLVKLHDVRMENYKETKYGAKTSRMITLHLNPETLTLMKEVEEALKVAALRLGKINNKKITRDVLDDTFRSRLFTYDDEFGAFTVSCGETITVAKKEGSDKRIDFPQMTDYLKAEGSTIPALRVAVQPTYLWSQTPLKIGISWELKVVAVAEWPMPPSIVVVPAQPQEKQQLPSLDGLLDSLHL